MPGASERRVCRVLEISRTSVRNVKLERKRVVRLDPVLVSQIHDLIRQYPTFGYRRLWAWLRFRQGVKVNRKTVYRVLAKKRWFVHQRVRTPRPRVRGWVSAASVSNERWAPVRRPGRGGW